MNQLKGSGSGFRNKEIGSTNLFNILQYIRKRKHIKKVKIHCIGIQKLSWLASLGIRVLLKGCLNYNDFDDDNRISESKRKADLLIKVVYQQLKNKN